MIDMTDGFNLSNADGMIYIIAMETAYPVRKALQFTDEQWERVRAFRFAQKIGTEAEAVRRLIELGLRSSESMRANEAKAADGPTSEV